MRALVVCLGLSLLPFTAHARGDTVPVRVLQADAEPSGHNLLVFAPAGPGGQWQGCAAVTIQLHFERTWSRDEDFERKYQAFESSKRMTSTAFRAMAKTSWRSRFTTSARNPSTRNACGTRSPFARPP